MQVVCLADNPLPTMMTPNRKLTALEAIRFLGYRGEGSKYENAPNSIGNNRHTECHVFETRKSFPLEMTTIEYDPALAKKAAPSLSVWQITPSTL